MLTIGRDKKSSHFLPSYLLVVKILIHTNDPILLVDSQLDHNVLKILN